MRTIGTVILGLIFVATGPASAQDQAKKSATPVPATVSPIKDGWVFSVWFDASLKDSTPAKQNQDQLRICLRDAVDDATAANPEIRCGIDEYDVNDDDRTGRARSPKEAFDKLPSSDAWMTRLKQGDVLVVRERVKDGKLVVKSFPICLGGPLAPEEVMNGLLKQPLQLAKSRPGDILVLWHAGDKQQAILDCEAVAKLAQLKFEECDINTPEGKAKFDRPMAKFSPATRLKLIQEAKTTYLQLGWAMDNDTIQFGEPQELSSLVPVTDTATLFVSKTPTLPAAERHRRSERRRLAQGVQTIGYRGPNPGVFGSFRFYLLIMNLSQADFLFNRFKTHILTIDPTGKPSLFASS